MSFDPVTTSLTTDADGDASKTLGIPSANGLLNSVYIDIAAGETPAVTVANRGITLFSATVSADTWYMPRRGVHTTAGVALLYAGGGTAVSEAQPINGDITITIASGGATKTHTITVWIERR